MFDVIGVAQDQKYKLSLSNALASIYGIENKEDAESSAIVALLEEEPITLDDCIDCMKRAIGRFRNHSRKIYDNETSINELPL
jgi:hypothetical protein